MKFQQTISLFFLRASLHAGVVTNIEVGKKKQFISSKKIIEFEISFLFFSLGKVYFEILHKGEENRELLRWRGKFKRNFL